MTTSSLWSKRTRTLNKSSAARLMRRTSGSSRRKVPHSSACSPKNILARATISGFSPGSNQNVGFLDQVPSKANHPDYPFKASNLGEQLIKKGLSFKGYSESLPNIGSTVDFDPPNCRAAQCVYARKHVPWISFANIPNGTTVETSSNLRFADFPRDYTMLPTVAFVIPNLNNDMHNGKPAQSIPAGDTWLRQNLDDYYQWAKRYRAHQSAHRTRPAILAQVQPPATRSSEPSRHHF